MTFRGVLSGIHRSMEGKLVAVFETDATARELDGLKALGELCVECRKYKKKRSPDANAYYWQLLTKLAEALRISKPAAHNMMLRRYGQMEFLDGMKVRIPVPDTEGAEQAALEAQTYHIRPTSQVMEGKDGKTYRTYVMLRGSSTYDTGEMGELIEGLVSECRELGIETLPPEELERMMETYGKRNHNGV